jgi:hypothetical protein
VLCPIRLYPSRCPSHRKHGRYHRERTEATSALGEIKIAEAARWHEPILEPLLAMPNGDVGSAVNRTENASEHACFRMQQSYSKARLFERVILAFRLASGKHAQSPWPACRRSPLWIPR